MSYAKKDEDADASGLKPDRTSGLKLDRIAVYQDAKMFDAPSISPRPCRALLTKIAILLFTGEKYTTEEATELFAMVSKLFQNKDPALRQMVYIVLKELASTAQHTIMVNSVVTKDMTTSSEIIYKANSVRAVCRVIDATTAESASKAIPPAIVNKSPSVSSAALVTSYHLLPILRNKVEGWQEQIKVVAGEVKSSGGLLNFTTSSYSSVASTGSNHMNQYHAIGLLCRIRSHDKMALSRMINDHGAAGAVKSPAGVMMLVRLVSRLAEEDPSSRASAMKKLDEWLKHKSEMVNFEAAKAICEMRDVTDAEAAQAIHVLQLFLTSPRAVTKFAAIRILHRFASFKPKAINSINLDIEALVSNSNRSIATLAITTLMKTGTEASVDRLMKQVSGFITEITDEFKITVVEAIRTLCLKFPSKQAAMLTFLSGILRDEGGYEFKRAVVESMFDLIKFVPSSKEETLSHLCEFIEDCEFTKLAVRTLHFIGVEGPETPQPTKYIRYIYNRVVLENALVRAAAVTALAKFGVGQKDPEVKKSVRVLLARCLDDTDDEVRDRATLNLRLMDEEDDVAERFVKNDSMFSLSTFEHTLVMYVTSEDTSVFSTAFDVSTVPVVSREQALAEERTKKLTPAMPTLKAPTTGPVKPKANGAAEGPSNATLAAQKYTEIFSQIPDIKPYGPVLKSSSVVELTESETEYMVAAVKHVFKEHVVLQFDIKNTLESTVLENVSVVATPEDEESGLDYEFVIPAPSLPTNQPGVVYVAFRKTSGEEGFPISSFSNTLKFTSKEIDPTTGEADDTGYADEYEVETLDLTGADFVLPAFAGNFDHIWESTGANGEEATETLALSNIKSISDANEQLASTLALQPLEGTDVTLSNTTHTLKLYGKSVTGGRVAALVKMAYSAKSGVTVKLTVRADEADLAAAVLSSVA